MSLIELSILLRVEKQYVFLTSVINGNLIPKMLQMPAKERYLRHPFWIRHAEALRKQHLFLGKKHVLLLQKHVPQLVQVVPRLKSQLCGFPGSACNKTMKTVTKPEGRHSNSLHFPPHRVQSSRSFQEIFSPRIGFHRCNKLNWSIEIVERSSSRTQKNLSPAQT